MPRIKIALSLLAAGLIAGHLFIAAPLAAQEANEARQAKILANLKLAFPQLEQANVTMGALKPSGYEGLDEGSFVVDTPRGQQSQAFLVSSDDKKLYLLATDPIDVSRSAEDIQAELARREAEEAEAAQARKAELAAAVTGQPTRGKADAPVTIIEFSDFQCPYCARGAETVEEILKKYPDRVKFVFKHFPLNIHPWALPAAIAANCAAGLSADAFWTLHDRYFEHQREITPANVVAKSKEYLEPTGIDLAKWSACAEDQESEAHKAAAAAVDADLALGQKMGVNGTPGFFVNGEFLNGAQPITAFEPLIEKVKSDS